MFFYDFLFLAVLQGLRWSWSEIFPLARHLSPTNGTLDMRGIDLNRSPAFSLDGEWSFYPGRLLSLEAAEATARPIQLPGDWNGALDSDSSYGSKELLANTDLKIYDIAGKVGYGDTKYFSRSFEKYTGAKPSEYRAGARGPS